MGAGKQHTFSRRETLGMGVMGGLALGLPIAPRFARAEGRLKGGKSEPRNIIFMVSDGMSMGALTMAEPFSQQVRGRGTRWYELMRDDGVVHGCFATGSLNSLVTDSAAASSAWASGSRVNNGALNVLPDGTRLTPIADIVRDTGRRIGLVTTTQMTHATPAGFATVQPSREDHAEIAPQYLGKVDVLMGGGIEYFAADQRGDDRDLIQEYVDAGYVFWNRRAQVTGSAHPDKVLGLFGRGHLPYTLDWRREQAISEKVPTLAEMTRTALDILARGPGFLLQVEGGRVDHAAHNNDAAALLWDQLAFDDAVAVVLDWAGGRDDTLVIVTTDHGNSNPGLNGVGGGYADTDAHFALIAEATASFDTLGQRVEKHRQRGDTLDAGAARDLVAEACGIQLSDGEADMVRQVLTGEAPRELYGAHANRVGILGQALANHTGVAWTSVSHTSDLVWRSAVGPGAAQFSGLMHSTEAFHALVALLGREFRNPQVSADTAKSYTAANAGSFIPHWV